MKIRQNSRKILSFSTWQYNLTLTGRVRKISQMNTIADPTSQPPITKKCLILFVMLLCFFSGCTNSNSPKRTQTQYSSSRTVLPKATITPLSRRFHSSYNGGVLAMEYSNTGNLWDKIPASFQIPDESSNPAVQTQIRWFMKHQQYLDRTSRRAAPYIYYIYEQVQQRQLPTELVLLPINESAYNPFSTSVAGAGGIWQMTRGTASQYHVKQNWWYDGRRDVYTSTRAALDHLSYLQNFFNGDWLLALAAYNCGEGTVQRAIRRNAAQGKPTDFWSLPLPEETRAYVPRLLALAAILRDRQAYNLELPPIEDQPYLTQVDVETPVSLGEAAQLAGMNLSELKQLNPGHKYTGKTPQGPFKLVLPIDRVDVFKSNLAGYSPSSSTRFAANDNYDDAQENAVISPTPTPSRQSSGQAILRIVKRGDNLATIAKLYKVSSQDIKHWNHLTSNRLRPGTRLVVGYMDDTNTRQSPVSRRSSTTKPTYYTVRSGDTLARVAKHHQISINSLQVWNHLGHNSSLKPGQHLIVRRG